MRKALLGSAIAAALTLAATSATAALHVAATSLQTIYEPGDVVTIDITITTTGPEALALGLRAANYDPTILTNGQGTTVPASIFQVSPVGFFGLVNTTFGLEEPPLAGLRPGWSINLFQGVSLTPQAGAGPEFFQIQFIAGAPGITTVDVGALPEYQDLYAGGDNVANNTSITIEVVPEPSTAFLLSLGLATLAAARRAR